MVARTLHYRLQVDTHISYRVAVFFDSVIYNFNKFREPVIGRQAKNVMAGALGADFIYGYAERIDAKGRVRPWHNPTPAAAEVSARSFITGMVRNLEFHSRCNSTIPSIRDCKCKLV